MESLSHVAPGDPLVIPAATWNEIIDAVRVIRADGPRARGAGAALANLERPALTVRVKASATLPNRAIITLGAALIDPDTDPLEAARGPLFAAAAPVSGDVPAVLLAGLSSGEVGRAVVQGVCVASVVISSAAHDYAAPVAGDVFSLASATSGPFRLLTNPGVGTANCLVALGPEPPATGAANYLAPVRVATTTAGTLSTSFANGQTVDGVTLATGDPILIKNQSTGSENGTYTVNASGAPTRRDTTGAQFYGAIIPVTNGTTNGDSVWLCSNNTVPTVGSTALTFVRVGPGGAGGVSGSGTGLCFAYWTPAGAGATTLTSNLNFSIDPSSGVVSATGVDGSFRSFIATNGINAGGFVTATSGSSTDASISAVDTGPSSEAALTLLSDGVSAGLSHQNGTNVLRATTATASGSFRLVGAAYEINDGTFTSTGYTGTLAPGMSVTGGIITSAGSGSFVGTASNNTFTGSNNFTNTGFSLRDTNGSHSLTVAPGSDLTAGRTFTLTTGDADRTLDISAGSVTITTAGNALTSAADASAQRTVLGLGTGDSPTFAGATLSSPLAAASGGTGVSSTPTNGQVLIGNGSGYALATLTAGSGISITNGAGSITIAATGGGGGVTSVAATAPAAGFTISGSPITSSGTFVFALSDDLAALEAMAGTGLVARTASNTYAQRTLTGPASGITVTNGNGVSGNPTLALANDLAALEALTGTNTIYYRSGTDTWSPVTIGSGLTFFAGTLDAVSSTGGVTDGDYGDITVSSLGTVWTIDNNVVTYAKMQDVSATQRLIGRNSAGSGDPEEITLSQTLDWATGTAADGNILVRSSGSWVQQAGGTQATTRDVDAWNERWFANTNASGSDPFIGAAISSGTNTTAPSGTALDGTRYGGVLLRQSATANSGYLYQTVATAVRFGTTNRLFRAHIFHATALANRTIRVGFHDSTTSADATDGVYFEIVAGVATGKTASNSTRSTTGTTHTATVNVWYIYEIEVNAAGTTATFRVLDTNETQLYSQNVTTNIPTASGRESAAGIVATANTGAAADICVLGYMGFGTRAGYNKERIGYTPPQATGVAAVANVLHNGGFEVWQRGTSNGTADGSYQADRWYTLVDTTGPVASQQAGTLGARYALRLLQQDATARRMGEAQAVEASDSIPYRGRTVRFQFDAKASTSTAIRFAILEWTGTADTITRDVVNNWASSTYTAGNFFVASNVTVTAVGSGTATTSFSSFSVTGTVSSSCNNLIVFVWTENTVAQNVTLDITECGLYDGTTAQEWIPRPLADEIALCQRYFYSSYALNTTPGAATNDGAIGYAAAGTAGEYGPTITYPHRMRTTPTYVIYSPNSGVSSRRFNATDGVDETVSAFNLTGPGSHSGMNLAHTAGKVYRYHFTASADL